MSFCMLTDKYPDNNHKKFQTATLIRNAFSVDLNLVHNPKSDVYGTGSNFELRLEMPAGTSWAFVATPFLLSLLYLNDFQGQFKTFPHNSHG